MFDRYLTQIANAYAATPPWAPPRGIVRAWQSLADNSDDRAAGIRLLLNIHETDDPEPYPDAATMCADIAGGAFVVSRAHSEHPIWTLRQNVNFRIVHDVLGHYAATVSMRRIGEFSGARDFPEVAGFDWAGENLACAAHGALLYTPDQRMALFCECIAQTAYAIDRGGFTDQRCDDLSMWPYEIAPLHADRREEAISAYASWLDTGV